MSWQVITGDCVEVMAEMAEASVDAVVTDPPYGLEFMGKEWDRLWRRDLAADDDRGTPRTRWLGNGLQSPRYEAGLAAQSWHQAWATEALRVLKPGGHLLAFGGTRTYHRLTCALEDAGFEIRDCLAWLYGSGFPKSLDVSRAIDKAAGAEREVVGAAVYGDGHVQNSTESIGYHGSDPEADQRSVTAPATPDAERWQGFGTALKPAFEPIVLARKPLTGTVAANVLEHGTGSLNVDGCRVEGQPRATGLKTDGTRSQLHAEGWSRPWQDGQQRIEPDASRTTDLGRWPANVVLDEAAAGMLDEQSGTQISRKGKAARAGVPGEGWGMTAVGAEYDDTGGASRFFYTAKASSAERNRGREHAGRNEHPTVKPVDLMQWLCRLITPPGGTVLDPFTGSGTTGMAALREGFDFIGIERDPDYVEISRDRIVGDAPLFNVETEARNE